MTESPHRHSIELDLLLRYLAGQAAPGEVEAVQQWLTATPENAETLAALRQALDVGAQEVDPSDAELVWQRLAPRLASSAPPIALVRPDDAPRPPAVLFFPQRSRSWLPAAAAAAILLAAGMGAWRAMMPSQPAPPPVAAADRVISTPRGQRLALRLPDGTLVALAPSSTLRFSPAYGDRDRIVRLDGEAAFTVVHDSTRPLIVKTARADAVDLGTRFVVRAYPDEPAAHVAVAEGRVAVRAATTTAGGDSVLLVARDVAQLAADGRMRRVPGVALDRYFAWTEGRLVFRDTPLRQAAAQLGRWYDVEVRLASDSMAELPVTASFAEQPASEALRLVALTLDLRLSQGRNVFTLSPR